MASSAPETAPGGSNPAPYHPLADIWIWAALAVSLLTLIGSLSLSLAMGLRACPLCFYQRAFAMSLVAVLGMGLLTGAGRYFRLSLLALPLAIAGLGVAAFHVWLEGSGALECPAGLLGLGTAPLQSLFMFVGITVLLVADVWSRPVFSATERTAFGGSILLGVLLAVGSSVANPPMPAAPTEPYRDPLLVCRPPFHPG